MKCKYSITLIFILLVNISLQAQKNKWTGKKDSMGEPHGYGKMIYKDGSTFEGEMCCGNVVKGTYTYTSEAGYECKYIGTFRLIDGYVKKDGFGQIWWKGNYYIGYFAGDLEHGHGTLVEENGTSKTGFFDNGVFYGGFITDKNGNLLNFHKEP